VREPEYDASLTSTDEKLDLDRATEAISIPDVVINLYGHDDCFNDVCLKNPVSDMPQASNAVSEETALGLDLTSTASLPCLRRIHFIVF